MWPEGHSAPTRSRRAWKLIFWPIGIPGACYALFHVSGLVAVAVLAGSHPDRARAAGRAGVAFALGVLLFTGSLWVLALTGQRALGMITPLGGLSFLAGWLLLGLAARGLGRG